MEMTDEEKKELRAIIREALIDALVELRHIPVPASSVPVTVITIRIGSGEMAGISTLGVGAVFYCMGPTGPGEGEPYAPLSLDDKNEQLLRRIMDKTGELPEEVIRRLEFNIRTRQLTEEIERYAKELCDES